MLIGGDKVYLGHLIKVPVYAQFDIIFLGLLAWWWSGGEGGQTFIIWLIVIFASILLHELGHAIVALARGMSNVYIVIGGLGGYCSFTSNPGPLRSLMISVAGPLMNFLLAWLAWLALTYAPIPQGSIWQTFVAVTFIFNLVLGIFNSVPLYPLDGGQALLALLRLRLRTDICHRVVLSTSVVSVIVGVAWLTQMNGGNIPWLTVIIGISCLFQAFRDLR